MYNIYLHTHLHESIHTYIYMNIFTCTYTCTTWRRQKHEVHSSIHPYHVVACSECNSPVINIISSHIRSFIVLGQLRT